MKKIFTICLFLLFVFSFTSCKKEYTYKFLNDDGTVLLEGKGVKGSKITEPSAPSKESTAEFEYEFIGWDNPVGTLTGDVIFKAQYKESTRKYLIRFLNDDDSVIKEEYFLYGTDLDTFFPKKPSSAEFDYEFIGWDKPLERVTKDETYKAKYTESTRKYLIRFLNEDGSLIKEEYLLYGTELEIENPTRESTAEFEYTFSGWDKPLERVTKDETYRASFKESKRKYLIKFISENKVIKEEYVEYGVLPTIPTEPTKKGNQEFSYTFNSWSPEVSKVTSDMEYTAVFDKVKNAYSCTFIDDDGTVLKSEVLFYGVLPTIPADPTKAEDDDWTYEFIGWDHEVKAITSDVIYKAVYAKTLKKKQFSSLVGKKVSILGDSISTFYSPSSSMNSYYSEVGRYYYPTYCQDVKEVGATWWGKLLANTSMNIGINNSWSGSTAIGNTESAGCSDARIKTLVENGSPDIVILYLGTNDVCSGFDANNFIEAYEMILKKLYAICAPQVYVCTLGYSPYKGMKYTEELRLAYNQKIKDFANKHDLGIIPLDEYVCSDNYQLYLNDNLHYKFKGTTLLAQIAEKAICDYNGLTYDKTIDVEHPIPDPVGYVKIGYYNEKVWDDSVISENTLLYSYDALDKGSSFIYYYFVKIVKDGDNYKVVGKKNINVKEDFTDCDYYIMISINNQNHKFYDEVNIGDYLKLTGEITSGNCEFTLITD